MTHLRQRERMLDLGGRQGRPWLPDLVHRMTNGDPGEGGPLLPQTIELLRHLERASCAEDLEGIASPAPGRVAAYRALPETNLPFLKLRVAIADEALLAFAGRPAPGFEVIEVLRMGFQYHWRRDLVRACDEQLPLLGRFCGLSGTRELVVDHLAVPVSRKGRVREVWGWLIFGEDLLAESGAAFLEDISMFRRSGTSRPLRLPSSVMRPRAEAARLQEMLRNLRSRWGEGPGRSRPC